MTETKQPKQQPTEMSQRIRVLLKEGRSPAEIMALTGAKRHIVGLVKYHMERQENIRISPATGKPVRKYTKRKKARAKAVQAQVQPKEARVAPMVPEVYVRGLEQVNTELKAKIRDLKLNNNLLKAEVATLRLEAQTQPQPQVQTKFIEIPVPQPLTYYTFWQRLRILFLGRAA